ncbi:MAG: transposase [Lysobacteraceae bacterium]
MTAYRRARTPGACWFFTVNLAERRGNRRLVENVDVLRAAFSTVHSRRPFHINAIVVLPDHLHCIWTLPQGDADYATRWGLIKAKFSRALPAGERINASRQSRGERGIWQRRFWEHQIRDDRDFEQHVDYIHFNPVKHGHVSCVKDWPHSSFHRFVARGIYPLDWGGTDVRIPAGE